MKAKSDQRELCPEDWYFLDCPPRELAACCHYEYARYFPGIVEAVQDIGENVMESMLKKPSVRFIPVFVPKFPDLPWLKLREPQRLKLVSHFDVPPSKRSLVVANFGKRSGWHDALPAKGPCVATVGSLFTRAVIEIDWQYGLDDYLEAFQRFYRESCPEKKRVDRGRGRSYADFLNALGAKRLLEHCRDTKRKSAAAAALGIIRSHCGPGSGRSQPYSRGNLLDAAAKRVEENVSMLYYFDFPKALQSSKGIGSIPYWHIPKGPPPKRTNRG